jgi:hypothetical protein
MSIALPWIIFIPLMACQGSTSNVIADRIIILVNWPSFLLGVYPIFITQSGDEIIEFTLIDPKVYLVNAIGWGIVGFIVGLTISAVKGRRRTNTRP